MKKTAGFCLAWALWGSGALGLHGSVAAAGPAVLPTPVNLPPCQLNLPAHAAATFPCNVILGSDTGLSSATLGAAARQAGAQVRFEYAAVDAAAAVVPDKSTLQALAALPGLNLIPDRQVGTGAKPGKTVSASSDQVIPAGVQRIGAAPGQLPLTGRGVGVAVADSGLDFAHRDLAVQPACFDAFGGNCQDFNGHGTHVGGIIAALDNEVEVVGVAPEASLYAVKVLSDEGSGSDATVLAGLDWVAQHGGALNPPIAVVNLSLGRPGALGDNPVLHAMVRTLTEERGVTLVVAAGNDPTIETSARIPAAYPEVISVASTTAAHGNNDCRYLRGFIGADTASYYTTDGPAVTVSAPGNERENISRGCLIGSEGILSLRAGGGTVRMNGTSMAAPHVTGVVALLHEQQQLRDPGAIRAAIQGGADSIGIAPLDSPVSSYSFDGVREGVLSACGSLGLDCL